MGDMNETLLELSLAEQRIARVLSELRQHPLQGALARDELTYQSRLKELSATEALVLSLSEAEAEIEAEIELLREKLAHLAHVEDAPGGFSFRNASAHSHEVDVTKGRLEELEGEALELLERQEVNEGVAVNLRLQTDVLQGQILEDGSRWGEEKGRLEGTLAELSTERDRLLSQLDEASQGLYHRIANTSGGIALSSVEGALCTACGVTLSRYELDRLKAVGTPISLSGYLRCEECGRVLLIRTS